MSKSSFSFACLELPHLSQHSLAASQWWRCNVTSQFYQPKKKTHIPLRSDAISFDQRSLHQAERESQRYRYLHADSAISSNVLRNPEKNNHSSINLARDQSRKGTTVKYHFPLHPKHTNNAKFPTV